MEIYRRWILAVIARTRPAQDELFKSVVDDSLPSAWCTARDGISGSRLPRNGGCLAMSLLTPTRLLAQGITSNFATHTRRKYALLRILSLLAAYAPDSPCRPGPERRLPSRYNTPYTAFQQRPASPSRKAVACDHNPEPARPQETYTNSPWRRSSPSPSTTLRPRIRRRFARGYGRSRACWHKYVFPMGNQDLRLQATAAMHLQSILASSHNRVQRNWGNWPKILPLGNSSGCRKASSGTVSRIGRMDVGVQADPCPVVTRVADCLDRLLGMSSSKGKIHEAPRASQD